MNSYQSSGTSPQSTAPAATPEDWLAAVEASDIPEDTKAAARVIAACARPDGTVDETAVQAALQEQDGGPDR